MWYTAHLLMLREFLDGRQDIYAIWENIFLIEAASDAEAFAEADRLGQAEEEGSNGSISTYDGRPVRWKYAGVRRLAEFTDFEDGPPSSGREVTYLSYSLENVTDLQGLLEGQSVRILLDGKNRD